MHIDIASVASSVALPSLYPPPPQSEEGESVTYRSKEQGEKSGWRLPREEDVGFVPVPPAVREKA